MALNRPAQYFSLRWNNYQNTMTSVFQQLREDQSFVDVTLSCENGSLKAHKVSLFNWLLISYLYFLYICRFSMTIWVLFLEFDFFIEKKSVKGRWWRVGWRLYFIFGNMKREWNSKDSCARFQRLNVDS